MDIPTSPVGPNPVLAPSLPETPGVRPHPTGTPEILGTTSPLKSRYAPTLGVSHPGDKLINLLKGAFQVLTATNPDTTHACWLYYETSPLYYEWVGLKGNFFSSTNHSQCWWRQQGSFKMTLSLVSGRGTCVGKIPPVTCSPL